MYDTGGFVPHPRPEFCQSQGLAYDVAAQKCAPPPAVAQLPSAYPPPAYSPPPAYPPAYSAPPVAQQQAALPPLPPVQAQPAAPSPPSVPQGPLVPVESDAVIYDDLKGNTKLTDALAAMVRMNDYRCDSISAVRPYLTVKGFKLVCNHFDYSYDIEDKGGHWVVKVE